MISERLEMARSMEGVGRVVIEADGAKHRGFPGSAANICSVSSHPIPQLTRRKGSSEVHKRGTGLMQEKEFETCF